MEIYQKSVSNISLSPGNIRVSYVYLKCKFTSWRKFHKYFTFQKPRGRGAGSAGSGNNNNNNNSLQAPGQTTTPTPLSKNDNNSTVTKMDTSPIPPGNRNLNVSLF